MAHSSNIQGLLGEAESLFTQGDLPSAAAAFEALLEMEESCAPAWIGLGRLALSLPDIPVALDFFGQAVALQSDNAEALMWLGDAQRRAGLTEDADISFRRALALRPDDLVLACRLANNYVDRGELLEAKELLSEILEKFPSVPELYLLRGMTYLHLGSASEAETDLRFCLGLSPNHAGALAALGGLLLDRQLFEEASSYIERAAQPEPDREDVLRAQGAASMARRDWKEAITHFDKVLALFPKDVSASLNRALALVESGEAVAAIDALEFVLSLGASEQWVHEMIGVLFAHQGQWEVAIENLERAVEHDPGNVNAWNVLIVAYNRLGFMEKSVDAAKKVLEINSEHVSALVNLAGCYIDLGLHDEGVETFRKALAVDPVNPAGHSGLMFGMLFSSQPNAVEILAQARTFDNDVCLPLFKNYSFPQESGDPDRVLRIGWVSSDLRAHPVGAFIAPFFSLLNPSRVESYVYSNWSKDDAVTAAIKPTAKVWRNIRGLGDNAVAECVRTDRIDILVDLNGHTAGHRLGVFARKPAPIQVGWLGFPGTSGMSAIDYVFVPDDEYLAGGTWCAEKPWRLPGGYGVRSGLPGVAIRDDLPFDVNGYFTFACMNRYSKVSTAALDLWALLLSQVENSRLILIGRGGKDEQTLKDLRSRFAAKGIGQERLEILGAQPFNEYLETYNRADLCLDPFPFNGGTTGFDSIWMGVPFITLRGDSLHSRAGSNILKYVALEELIAESSESYVEIASELSRNLPALRRHRSGLRERMQASPLMDCQGFARDLEDAFHRMWQIRCRPVNN